MNSKEEICSKLFDYHQAPSKLLSIFTNFSKPLIDLNSVNRLSGRKLSQVYCPALVSIIKQCTSELSKKNHEDYIEYLLELMQNSLMQLSKLQVFYFENLEEYYNMWYSLLIRMNDLKKYKQTLKISLKITEEIEKLEIHNVLVNFYILSCNCILQVNDKGISGLEKAYDLLAIKCKNIIVNNKKAFDGQSLNKIYYNVFKLLMKTGKHLDNLSAGNISLHEQALSIRTSSLQFLQKTRPFISTDYFAFVYSSVLGSYKIGASCNSKALFQACIDSIDSSLEISNLPYQQDKNLRNLIELKSFLLFKVENYYKIKHCLSVLLTNSDNLVLMLYNIRYYLDISRASFLGKLELILDLETTLNHLIALFDNKLTSPSVLITSELIELKELAPKMLSQFDNWIRLIANLHNPSTIKTGMAIPAATMKMILDILKYMPKLIRFQEKLAVNSQIDLCLYYYTMFLNSILLYISTRDSIYITQATGYLNQLVAFNENKYLSNCYNLTLGLLHSGEKELSIKLSIIMLDSLSQVNQINIAIIEFASKHVSDNLNHIKYVNKSILDFIGRQVITNDIKHANEIQKIIEVYCWLQFKEIEMGGEFNCPLRGLNGEKELLGIIFAKEIDCYHKKLLSLRKPKNEKISNSIIERIQEIEKILLWNLYPPYSSNYISTIVTYIEILSTCSSFFTNEKIISSLCLEITSYPQYNLHEQIMTVVSFLILKTSNPLLMLWQGILLFEQIKENEKSLQSEWISKESIINSCKIRDILHNSIQLFAEKLGYRVCEDELELLKISLNENYELSIQEMRGISLGIEICRLLKMHDIEIQFINLLYVSIKNSNGSKEYLTCLEYRKKATLIYYGKEYNKVLSGIEDIKEIKDNEVSYSQCWTAVYYSEVLYLEGNIEESQQLLSRLLALFPNNQEILSKEQLLKSNILYILSCISLVQGNYTSSMSLCKDARILLKEIQINTLTFHNLSLISSLNDSLLHKSYVVYPITSWSFQYLSSQLSNHLADIYIHLSQIPSATVLLTQGIRLGRLLGIPSVFLYYRSRLCTLYRQSQSDLIHDNIKEQKLETINPIEFVEEIFTQYFAYFLEVIHGEHKKSEHYDCITIEDTKEMCRYIDRESLCMALMTLGDILQTPSLYNQIELQVAEQNYYNLAKVLLDVNYRNYRFTILRSLIFRKLALLSYRQHPDKSCVALIEKSVLQIACCNKYLQKSCCGLKISPLLYEELGHSLLNLADALMKQSKNAQSILSYIINLPNTNNPVILNHVNYLIAKNPSQDIWQRCFHTFQSIGSSYDHQAFFLKFSDPEDFFNELKIIPEEWTIIGISIGRGNFNDGTVISKIQKGRDPNTFLIGNMCCTGRSGIYKFLEEFCEIMKESASTTSKNNGVIRTNSSQWWDKRERLNERLKNLLDRIETQYFAILSALFIGKIKDPEIDNLVYFTAQELVSTNYCCCGQIWDFQVVYYLLIAYLCDLITIECFKSYLLSSIYTKLTDEILKKLRYLKKKISDKKIIELSPVILIISGQLLHFPWESLPILQRSYTTRIPTIRFLLSRLPIQLQEYKNGYFILNPSKDLESTQRTFESFFQSHNTWTGISGSPPTESEFAQSLTSKDLVIYCGHSSGEQYIKGEKIKEIKVNPALQASDFN